MKKKVLSKILSVAVSLSVAASTFTSLSVVAYAAKDEVEIPDPVAVYDFSYDFEELAEMNEGFEVVQNEAAPELVIDPEMGQVLQLGKTVIGEREYAIVNGAPSGYLIKDESQYSTINIANPYKDRDYLKEYETWEDVDLKLYRSCEQPYWKEGITISYWIKAPVGEDGYGVNSNVVGFSSNRFQMQADDLAKYLSTVIYGRDYNEFTEEEKEILDISFAGVNRTSDFYIELAEEESYNGKPLYVAESLGDLYWYNQNYEEGYLLYSDGTIEPTEQVAVTDGFKSLPYLGDSEDDHDPRNSAIRYAWTYSEMWLDSTSSFYFENDTANVNIQLNTNNTTTYGTKAGMQNNDCFNINSWKGSADLAVADADGMAAPSPATEPDEWHHVVCVIQNDWVVYYLDGEEIDIEEYYSSFGGNGLATTVGTGYKPWKRFNKGTGSRYGYGHDKTVTYDCSYGNYVAATMMEWIVKDCVNATIGGGNVAGDGYMMYADTDEILLKNIAFYDVMLTEKQIEGLTDTPYIYDKQNQETENMLGDVDLDTIINAADALAVLKHAANLVTLEGEAVANADVNTDTIINASDALEILKYAAGLISEFTPVQ